MASESGEKKDSSIPPKGALYHCDYCRRDISTLIRIRCCECSDFDLCLDCFARGYTLSPHLNTHSYRVVEHVRTPIYETKWGADEELLLLEGIETYGFGNWADISDHVGSKNKTECELHYDAIYLSNNKIQYIPDNNKLLIHDDGTPVKTDNNPNIVDTSNMQLPVPQIPPNTITKPKPRSGLGHLVGYIPARGDFDTEYDNDAELILADMEFKVEDTKWERELKLKVLDIYNSKLDARFERKKFILDRGLLERKEKKRSKEEREVYNNMRVFARFHSAAEHEQFIQGLLNEQRLRKRIEQLQQYRLNGIKTLADAEIFEQEKKKREATVNNRKNKDNVTGSTIQAGNIQAIKSAGKRTAEEITQDSDRTIKINKKDLSITAGATNNNNTLNNNSNILSIKPSSGVQINPNFNIDQLDCVELLSQKERELCIILQLIPVHYLAIKDKLLREVFARGYLKEGQAKQLIRIDINKTQKLFDFFVSVGWINTQELISGTSNSNDNNNNNTTMNNNNGNSNSNSNTNIKTEPNTNTQPPAGKQPQLSARKQ